MKENQILRVIVYICIIILLYACTKQSTNINFPEINPPLLRDVLPEFEKEAKQWHEDAFLQDLNINLNEINSYKVDALYLSPRFSKEQLGITITNDGKIICKEYETVTPYQYTNIEEINWKIDSGQALKIIFSKDEQAREFYFGNQKQCSFLSFTRFRTQIKNPPIVWTLVLDDCNSNTRFIDLNPITGEIIKTPE